MLENQNNICEFVLICPYKHKNEKINEMEGNIFSNFVFDYFNNLIENKIEQQNLEFSQLNDLINSNKCVICKDFFKEQPIISLKCQNKFCTECMMKDDDGLCRICTEKNCQISEI